MGGQRFALKILRRSHQERRCRSDMPRDQCGIFDRTKSNLEIQSLLNQVGDIVPQYEVD
jgi:hypothetical protein